MAAKKPAKAETTDPTLAEPAELSAEAMPEAALEPEVVDAGAPALAEESQPMVTEPVAEPVAVEPVVAEPAEVTPVVAEPVAVAPVAAEPVPVVPVAEAPVTTAEPVAVAPEYAPAVGETLIAPPAQQVIVVDAPVPPRKRGNRGVGFALALLASLVFAGLLVGADILLRLTVGNQAAPAITDIELYFPVIFFFVGLVLVTLVLNRAGWWSHIFGSVVVAAIVWFGSAGLVLLTSGVASMTQSEANLVYFTALFSPLAIVAALLAREVSIWTGAILARRGRKLKIRNAEEYAAFERERNELMPTA